MTDSTQKIDGILKRKNVIKEKFSSKLDASNLSSIASEAYDFLDKKKPNTELAKSCIERIGSHY